MDAKELMIGNLVRHETLVICSVTVVEQDACVLLPVAGGNPFLSANREFDPIELTPSVLDACGFELDQSMQLPQWEHKSGFSFSDNYFTDSAYSLRLMNRFDIELKSMHQLQNLFLSLTGSPLNVDAAKLI